ncbi:hypothetical protein CSC94_05885 [Zhengella mangrovi]|uniref:Gene transfer agent family protein n=1 Tax=Zhengella mangrovi TaxID=1982044 RepID=A0A2G1QRU6_9HYPH|nr:gene transfer agent family protein [Zhengella mangrovi]PHP68180.1 hypothetical protein CSC94_05885 [Zhengella mangrovi]
MPMIWAGGEHEFTLRLGELRALQASCDAGPYFVLQRLSSGRWLVEDVIEPIRLGLLGAGMDRAEVNRLVERHVEGKPLLQSAMTAQAILTAALIGEEDDPVGDEPGEPEAGEPTNFPAENGNGPDSTDPAP